MTQPRPTREVDAEHRSEHKNISVSKIDKTQNPINHGITQRDQGVNSPQLQTLKKLLKKNFQVLDRLGRHQFHKLVTPVFNFQNDNAFLGVSLRINGDFCRNSRKIFCCRDLIAHL